MSESLNPSPTAAADPPPAERAPDADGQFSVSEDWLAVVVGLALLTLALVGVIPTGLVP